MERREESERPGGAAMEPQAASPWSQLDYELPPELIAQHPAERREASRLLVVDRASGALTDSVFADLGRWLRPGDSLVLNETRVRPARLFLRRPTGGRVEMLFVRPTPPASPLQHVDEHWLVLARPARHADTGARLTTEDESLEVEVVGEGEQGERTVRIVAGSLAAVLRTRGRIPLPPYIDREPTPEDAERYQTVYARVEGAVAAPTAGLHFSESLLASLEVAGIRRVHLTLHVGPGTFRPVTTEDPREHRMDEEWFEISRPAAIALKATRKRGGRIVAVGTTTVRALETMAELHAGEFAASVGWTGRYILPDRSTGQAVPFRTVDALITNFHLPRTTLLLLVAAFAGERTLPAAYAHAMRERYRFYSYGDAMLVV